MKKLISFFVFILFFVFTPNVKAQTDTTPYTVVNFASEITINQDTSLDVTETIDVDFRVPRHGIFRDIPVVYSVKNINFNSKLKVLSVKNRNGENIKYKTSRKGSDIEIKIGDAEKQISGRQVYIINYQVKNILQQFDDHDELYWNVAGSAWDTDIISTSATVTSNFARISRTECYTGLAGSTEHNCIQEFGDNEAAFVSQVMGGNGRDMSIVVGLDKQNNLVFPGTVVKITDFIMNNLGYPIAIIPLIYILISWYRNGRDIKRIGDNVYYEQESKTEKAPLFARKFIPMVYYPINDLTPSQVGTLLDERVDMHDVVAEIVELARLKFFKIVRLDKKAFFGKSEDYALVKLPKPDAKITDYQRYLYDELFDSKVIEKSESKATSEMKKKIGKNEFVLLSEHKYKFYKSLKEFRKMLYQNMDDEGYFDGNPETVKIRWFIKMFIFYTVVFIALTSFTFINQTAPAVFPLIIAISSIPISVLVIQFMPRKKPDGYALNQQINGLKFYLKKGKWRQEVNEKHLFLEEMLPLAISLGVVKKLASDMEELNVKPPSYTSNIATASLVSNLSGFESAAGKSLGATPGSKSGGSGFGGGGFSGGGFGGGGGGSW